VSDAREAAQGRRTHATAPSPSGRRSERSSAVRVKIRFALALAALAGYVVAGAVLLAVGVYSGAAPDDQRVLTRVLSEQAAFLAVAGLLYLGGLGLFVARVFAMYVAAPKRLAAETRLMATVNPGHRLEVTSPRELSELAAAVNQLTDRYQAAAHDIEARIDAARADLAEERDRLAGLMGELTLAVIVCNVEGQILLYNGAARELLDPDRHGRVGLGRSVFGIVDRGLVAHGLDRVRAGAPGARLATTRGDRLLGVRVGPVTAADGEIRGFVLTLEDLTRRSEISERRDALLRTLTEGTRSSLGAIRAAIESMLDYPDMDPGQRHRFTEIIRDETHLLGDRVERALEESGAYLTDRWLLDEVLGRDLLAAAERTIRSAHQVDVSVDEPAADLWLEADSHEVVRALTDLVDRLRTGFGVAGVRLSAHATGRYAAVDVRWRGAALSAETVRAWTEGPIVSAVLERHGGEAWSGTDDGQAYCRVLLPRAEVAPATPGRAERARPAVGSRPEFYDFDLFRAADDEARREAGWGERRLDSLTYTVFDTETTGLHPAQGDEIVSIGAVRIVNGRLLRQETYEQLVDPGRPVPAVSRQVHGITDDMLEGAPGIRTVLPAFAAFADASVLVGHNVAFDLQFLKLKEAEAGVAFTQPVLDTLLLSPVVHPDHPDHSLEAIAGRLGVSVLGRHTALGDAIVTGEIFVRLLALLAGQGISTLGEAQEAARRTYQARVSNSLYGD
jgi:DNA polymerase-3 subunit epsilon